MKGPYIIVDRNDDNVIWVSRRAARDLRHEQLRALGARAEIRGAQCYWLVPAAAMEQAKSVADPLVDRLELMP